MVADTLQLTTGQYKWFYCVFFLSGLTIIMDKKASLPEVKRAQIVILQKEGYSEWQIWSCLKCSKTAVHTALVNFRNSGEYSDKKRSGRARKTPPRDGHLIRRIAARSPMSTSKKICSVLLATGTGVSSRTMSSCLLNDFNLKSCKPARKPRLTPAMKVKQLAFAKKHVSWTLAQWSRVLFSDEFSIQQFNPRKCHVRRPVGKRFDERYTADYKTPA